MSLNSAEIDKILSELPLIGSFIQNIRQIDYACVVLDLYNPGGALPLLISLRPGMMRINAVERKLLSKNEPARFVKYLRAHIKGGKIIKAEQIGHERIVFFMIAKDNQFYRFYIRIWGGAANILITDDNGLILDAFSRRPSRKEIPGEIYNPEDFLRDVKKSYTIRTWEGKGSYNQKIDAYYSQLESNEDLARLREKTLKILNDKQGRFYTRLQTVEQRLNNPEGNYHYKKYGDLIMANLHLLKKGDLWLTAEDYETPGTEVKISLDPKLSPKENGEKYYKKYSKQKNASALMDDEVLYLRGQLDKIEKDLSLAGLTDDTEILSSFIPAAEIKDAKEDSIPGLQFCSHGFQILVGRSADENDQLLRRFVRGNDIWLHVRDYPGGYVFIKTIKGKSVPLDVLLDAGNLAVHYSKAKNSGGADLFYTSVKYLRRVKEGRKGLVIPTQEKNLRITSDPLRLEQLLT